MELKDAIRTIPVSYTHLDVYKRQGVCRDPLQPSGLSVCADPGFYRGLPVFPRGRWKRYGDE